MALNGSEPLLTSAIQLQSKDHEEILNVIDHLRSEGIGRYVNLPQLIVCGDQSSGKSSVLEAISGLGFPVKDILCTRFATELILRRSPTEDVTTTIHPDEDRPVAEQSRIRAFKSSTVNLIEFEAIVKEAEKHIGVAQHEGHVFSKDVLRVEVSGPTQPHLTLVDLPGLYHAPDEFQSGEGVKFVESLVLSYIRNKRSVILAVVSAKNEIALQKVTAFTRKVDPKGHRTMGIITKPDSLPEDSDMERSFLQLAMNTRVPFRLRLGWHVLRNRDYKERHVSLDQRRETELEFLSTGVWSTLPRTQGGIDALKPRLSTVLKDHILSELPGLIDETQKSLNHTTANLQKLGEARQTLADQRRYLLQSSEKFTSLLGNAINGFYLGPFFGDAMEDDGYRKRLRAVVQNHLTEFTKTLAFRGMQRKIVDDDEEADYDEDVPEPGSPSRIRRSIFVDEVQQRMRRSRGRELPGTFNPLIIGDLFYLQSRPWESIVTEYIGKLIEDVQRAMGPILSHVLDERSLAGLTEHVLDPALDKIETSLRDKTKELLNPQQVGHPITYNHYFTENVQKARVDHLRRSIEEKLKGFFAGQYPDRESISQRYTFSMAELINTLGTETEANMERFAASEAVECMQAYYQVALKKFGDDFSTLAVEKRLLEPLAVIFSPRVLDGLSDDVVQLIASEDESNKVERQRLEEKLARLQGSLNKLHRLDRYHLSASKGTEEEVSYEDDDGTYSNNNSNSVEAASPGRSASASPDILEVAVEASPRSARVLDERLTRPVDLRKLWEER